MKQWQHCLRVTVSGRQTLKQSTSVKTSPFHTMSVRGFTFQVLTLVCVVTVQVGNGHIHDGRRKRPEESCERKTFDNYQVLQANVEDYEARMRLYKTFDQSVDFWTHPHANESHVDFLVSPSENQMIRDYLKVYKLPYKVLLSDVEKVIQSQINPSRGCGKKWVSKRSTRHQIRDFFTIMAHNAGTLIRSTNDGHFATTKRRSGYPYYRTARKAVQYGDPEVTFLDNRPQLPRMTWSEYHNLDTIYAFLKELEELFPDRIQIVEIGQTYEKRPILVAKIGRNIKVDDGKPFVLLEGGIHAREWISPAVATFIIRELVINPLMNTDVLDLYNFYVIPVTNPDGYVFSHRTNRMWRKNRSPNHGLSALLNPCWGVDLNRNFGFQWGATNIFNSVGGTRMPCLETYSGPRPFSEPETRAIRDFVSAQRKKLIAYISLHSYGEKVMYPWSFTKDPLPDWRDLHNVGIVIAEGIRRAGGHDYWVGSSSDAMYVTSGSGDDWFRGAVGLKWAFLLELPDKEFGFLLPPSEILLTSNSVHSGIKAGLRAISTYQPPQRHLD